MQSEKSQALNRFFSLPLTFFCTVSVDGYFSYFNHVFTDALGYSNDELKKQGVLNLVHPVDREVTRNEMEKLVADDSRVVQDFVNRCQHKNGSYRWLTWCSRYNQETDLLYAIGRDITEEKQTREKLETLLATKDKLFSILAHDLRGTLEGIKTMAELLKDDVKKEAESLLEGLNLIAASARSTNDLLNNQLNWFFMQLDTFKPAFDDLDIRECVKHGIDIYKSMMTNKGIKLTLTGPKVRIQGDWNMLCIVFRNLISNAIKFSYADSRIDTHITEMDEQVTVTIKDRGMGMPEDIKASLFDPDDQALRPGTNQEQSTGLGLQLCKEIVAMHKGKIAVESEEEKGTAFSVSLPTAG